MIEGMGVKADLGHNLKDMLGHRQEKVSSHDRSSKSERSMSTMGKGREASVEASSRHERKEPSFDDSMKREASRTERSDVASKERPSTRTEQAPSRKGDVEVKGEGQQKVADKSDISKDGKAVSKDIVDVKDRRHVKRNDDEIQKPVFNFMDSMESDFGIEPERLLGAMANMEDSELLDPPAETMGKFLDNLELQGEDREQAKLMYTNMLTDIEKADQRLGRYDKNVKMELLSSHGLRQKRLQNSIDKLTNKFFLNDSRQPYGAINRDAASNGEATALLNAKSGLTSPQDALNKSSVDAYQDVNAQNQLRGKGALLPPVDLPGQTHLPAPEVGGANLGAQQVNASTSQLQTQGALSDEALLSQFQMDGSEAQLDMGGDQASQQQFGQHSTPQVKVGPTSTGMSEFDVLDGNNDIPLEGGEEFAPSTQASGAATTSSGEKAQSVLGEAKVATMAEPTESDKATNYREMIKSARTLVRQGGGEMSLKLLPEGLGEMQVKVNVNQGKVDVQLVTQNQETKKHLESTINDLRAGLTDQKLSVETVKVDVADNVERELDMNQQNDPDREAAREFMQSFRDQNGSFRNAFLSGPGRETKDPGESREIQPSGDTKSERKEGKSGLHVIA